MPESPGWFALFLRRPKRRNIEGLGELVPGPAPKLLPLWSQQPWRDDQPVVLVSSIRALPGRSGKRLFAHKSLPKTLSKMPPATQNTRPHIAKAAELCPGGLLDDGGPIRTRPGSAQPDLRTKCRCRS